MGRGWIALGAVVCALGIGVAAFGAHALEGTLDARGLELWKLAGDYLLVGGFGLILIGCVAYQQLRRGFDNAALALFLGTLLFSGTVGALAFGAPGWVGAITPVGGILMILGFLLLAWNSLRAS